MQNLVTRREWQVLQLIAFEFSNKEIGVQLSISYETVRNHRKNLIKKLKATNTAGMIRRAMERGMIQMPMTINAN